MKHKTRLLTVRAISLLLCMLMILFAVPMSVVAETELGRIEETTTAGPEEPPFTTPPEEDPIEPVPPFSGISDQKPSINDYIVPDPILSEEEAAAFLTRSNPLVTDIPNGDYHIRNLRTGLLLREKATVPQYGCPVELGSHTTTIADEWIFEWQPGNSYVIRSALHPNSVLIDGGDAPCYTPIPEDFYGDMHIWYIYSVGDFYYIKSFLNDQYLCHDGTQFFMSSTQPTSINYSYLWDFTDADDYTQLTGFTVNNDRWMPVNGVDYLDITLTPSNASWAEYDELAAYDAFLWTTTDRSVAYVEEGRVHAGNAGGTVITATHRATELTYTFAITVGQAVPNGTYYIENVKSEKFMDIEGPSRAEGARIQQWEYNGSMQSRWTITQLNDGYYSIKSVYSNKYIGVESSVIDCYIEQYTAESDATKWDIRYSISGNWILIPYYWRNTPRSLVVPVGYENNGTDLRHGIYVEDDDFKDEWVFCHSAKLLGFDEPQAYDRSIYFQDTIGNITTVKNGFTYIADTSYYQTCDISNMIDYLDTYELFFVHTHGEQTGFYLGGGNWLHMNSISNLDLSNIDIAILMTCNTGVGYSASHITNNTPVNIVEQMVICGAETVVGFNAITYITDCNQFAADLTDKMVNYNMNITEAIESINYGERGYLLDMSDIAVIAGNGTNKIGP